MTKPFLEVGLGCAGTLNETTVLPKKKLAERLPIKKGLGKNVVVGGSDLKTS